MQKSARLFIITSFWLSTATFWTHVFYRQLTDIGASEREIQNLLKPVNQSGEKQHLSVSFAKGLFGMVKDDEVNLLRDSTPPDPVPSLTLMQGIFIHGNEAYVIASDRQSNTLLIAPYNIISFNRHSATVKTENGVQTIRLAFDAQGIDIHRDNVLSENSRKTQISEPLSKAQQIRLKLLSKPHPD